MLEVLFSFDQVTEIDPPERFTLGKCPGCGYTMLASETDYGRGWEPPDRLFPPADKKFGRSIPMPIREAHQEAVRCIKAKAYTASAIMCRKTLEGVCQAHGVKARNLASSLKELKEKGLIEGKLVEWAEALRNFGNAAAHGVELRISPEDARDIIEFTEALIEYVFTYKDKFAAFTRRQQKPSSASDSKR